MATYLLTWNPDAYAWDGSTKQSPSTNFPSLSELLRLIRAKRPAVDRWSTGNRKYHLNGERFFLLRLGVAPKGVVGSGLITSEGYAAPHWDGSAKQANYADVTFDALIDASVDGALPVSDIPNVDWSPQSGGTELPEEAAREVEYRWLHFLGKANFSDVITPDEVGSDERLFEGAQRRIIVNAYERNKDARTKCLSHHGTSCKICDLDFAALYGSLGKGFIHVHHLIPLSKISTEYVVDPVHDLLPVCPNCHAMLHRSQPTMKPEALRAILASQKAIRKS